MHSFIYCRKYSPFFTLHKINASALSILPITIRKSETFSHEAPSLPPPHPLKKKTLDGSPSPPCSTSVCKPPCSPLITAWEKTYSNASPHWEGLFWFTTEMSIRPQSALHFHTASWNFFLLVCSTLSAKLAVPIPIWVSCSTVVASFWQWLLTCTIISLWERTKPCTRYIQFL